MANTKSRSQTFDSIKNHPFRDGFLLLACGAAILFWELLFIRWMGSCIRIVAYFSNFILVATFLGLGAGALLARRKIFLEKLLFPVVCFCLILGPILGLFSHDNPVDSSEFFWNGWVKGAIPKYYFDFLGDWFITVKVPFWLLLGVSFLVVVFVFLILGQMLGRFFDRMSPLKAYSLEIAGSILGIILFSVFSFLSLPPTIWILSGFIILYLIVQPNTRTYLISGILCLMTLVLCGKFQENYIWSPYYKIQLSKMSMYHDFKSGKIRDLGKYFGFQLTVNNDFHQLIINLSPRPEESDFFKSWRGLYDYPYLSNKDSVKGRILIVGAGTGNDVSAALRNSNALIDVVEIDPEIIQLGKEFHPEKPYSNERVRIFNDDARHYFVTTREKYAKVVFGFLDSHTLLSSFSSVRLDNFVYTKESLERVKDILLPGGEVYLTFASDKKWIEEKIKRLLGEVFNQTPLIVKDTKYQYNNGIIFTNKKNGTGPTFENPRADSSIPQIKVPVDDWPFLYLKKPGIPSHYIFFIILVVLLSFTSLLLLPAGKRQIEFKYFFMGAGFFLIETSNIIKLSLLYGSTWFVNVTVFSGILLLILFGNWASILIKGKKLGILFVFLLLSCVLSYAVDSRTLLHLDNPFLQGILAVVIYLGPVFFASIIFAKLIRREKDFYAVYGSNLLGAMVGGSCEYFSLLMGFKFLILISMGFYFLAWIFVMRTRADNLLP